MRSGASGACRQWRSRGNLCSLEGTRHDRRQVSIFVVSPHLASDASHAAGREYKRPRQRGICERAEEKRTAFVLARLRKEVRRRNH